MKLLRTKSSKYKLTLLTSVSLVALSPVALATTTASTLPTGGQVAGGSAAISQQGSTLTVTQTSQRAILNWQTFNVGSGAQVNFNQPNSTAVALNRVLSAVPSEIDGKINANGQVYLINPQGIVFGAGAAVNVGGLVASTMDIANGDFMAGNNVFKRNGSTATIDNQGSLTATPGGMIALLAPELQNEGIVTANLGSVVMAAGEQVTLNINAAGGLINVIVDPAKIHTMIDNRSIVVAQSGLVILSAKAADALIGSTINNSGTIEASGLTENGGTIELTGATEITNSGTIDAGGLNGGRVTVSSDATVGTTDIGGLINVSGAKGTGGVTTVTGNDVLIDQAAHVNATGASGGGTINVGGSWENLNTLIPESVGAIVAPTALLDASATVKGDGGTVVVRSDVGNAYSVTKAYGTFQANAGPDGGNGGRIETSGHFLDVAGSQGGALAPLGTPGVWLFDPYDVTISSSASTGGAFNAGSPDLWTPSAEGSNIAASDIATELNGGTSVTITTSGAGSDKGNITVNSDIDKTSGNGDVSLTLTAQTDIHLNAAINNSGGTGKLNVQLTADSGDVGLGIIYLNGDITTGGGNLTFGSGATASLDGNTTLVGGDVYENDSVTHTLSTGGGNFLLNGQLIIRDPSGLTVSATNGTTSGAVTFAGAVDSGDTYTLVSYTGTWSQAETNAKSGAGGAVGDTYLATVTSHLEGEIVALTTIVGGNFQQTWLGAQRVVGIGTDNVWRWVTGPEGLKNNGAGLAFFTQNGTETSNGSGGTPINGMYNNWNGGEPNNSGGSGLNQSSENVIETLSNGLWNDFPATSTTLNYYVKETNAADSPLTVNAGGGLVTFSGTVGGNKPLSTLTLSSSNPNIDVNGGGVYTDNAQSYVYTSGLNTLPQTISLGGATNVTFATLNAAQSTSANQNYINNTGSDAAVTLSASGNLELASGTVLNANGHKLSQTLVSGGTLEIDSGVNLNSNGGTITLEANTLSVNSGASLQGGTTGALQIEPFTQGNSMGVGTGAGTLSVDSSYFTSNFINNTFGTVIFGGPTTGLLTVGATPALSHEETLFESGGNIALAADADLAPTGLVGFKLDSLNTTMSENASAVLNVSSLLLSGNSFYLAGTGAFNLTGAHNTVGTVAGSNAASVNLVDQGSLAVSTVGNSDVGTTTGLSTTGNITLQTVGTTADLTLSQPVTSTAGNIVLAAARNFVNNNSTNTGIVANGSGDQYFVYSSTLAGTTPGMSGYNVRYNQTYTPGQTPAVASSGNWFFYSGNATLTETLLPNTINYGSADPMLIASYSGFVNGDTATSANITGTVGSLASYTASDAGFRPAGTYAEIPSPSDLTNSLNYIIVSGGNGTLTVNKINATVTNFTAADKFFDGNTSATVTGGGGIAGLLTGDTASVSGGTANFSSSQSGNGKTVTESKIILGGADGGNYNVTTTGLTTLASIKASSFFLPPDASTVQAEPVPPRQQSETASLVSSTDYSVALAQSSEQTGTSQGVMVTEISSLEAGAGILANVGDDNGFSFTVPPTSLGGAVANKASVATMAGGGTLPTWLTFDPQTDTFSAAKVPPGGLPIVVAVNNVSDGKSIEVTISQ